MRASVRPLSSVFFGAAILFTAVASGDQIYRWVGADGETHFSETPPDAGPANVEILEVVPAGRVPPPVRDYRSALEVARDIESSRLERQRLRLEKKRLMLHNRQLRESAMISQEYDDDYAGVRLFYAPFYRYSPTPHRRRHIPRPVHPRSYSTHRWGHPGHARPTTSNARVHIR
jgi:hypothetical protein